MNSFLNLTDQSTEIESLAPFPTNSSTTQVLLTCEEVVVERVTSLGFTVVASIFLCYVIIALVVYMYKKRLFFNYRGVDTTHRSTVQTSLVIICGTLFTLVFVASQLSLIVPCNYADQYCLNYYYVKVISYGLSVFCTYFALWYRIFIVFYRNKFMRQNLSKCLQYINISSFPFLFLAVLCNLIVFLTSPGYESAGCGCDDIEIVENNALYLIRWTLFIVTTLVFQFMLLFSFIYPLHLHRKKMLCLGFEHNGTISLVKRAAIVGGVCVASDLANFGFAVWFQSSTLYIDDIVIRTNLLINLIATITAFVDWRDKLFPFGKTFKTAGKTSFNSHSTRIENPKSENSMITNEKAA